MNVNTPLHVLYRQLNPQADPQRDNQQLRADSTTGPLRLKTGKKFFTSLSKSNQHILNARMQVAEAIDESILSITRSSAVDSEVLRHAAGEHFNRNVSSSSRPLYLRAVKRVIDAFDGIVIQSGPRGMQEAVPSIGTDRKGVLMTFRAVPDEPKVQHPDTVAPLHEPQELLEGPFRNPPKTRHASERMQSSRGAGGQVYFHRRTRQVGQVARPGVPLKRTPFETKAASSSESGRAATLNPASKLSTRATAWLDALTHRYRRETIPSWTDHQASHFQQRLKELAAFADRIYPADVKATQPMPISILESAAYLKVSPESRPEEALYIRLTGELQKYAYARLSDASKRLFMPV